MPSKLPTPCRFPLCPNPAVKGGYCTQHQHLAREDARRTDERRGSARERGYTTAWDKARAAFLRQHPICEECARQGRLTPATVVDHIVPHRGNRQRFWDRDNWQALCSACHAAKTARGE